MKPVNILIADDHELVRDGIVARLQMEPGWQVCALAANGREAVELARRLQPQVAVLDIGMPELNGLDATRLILRESPQTAVLILTLQESEALIHAALAAGARGYVLKTDAARLLPVAIAALLEGKSFFTGAPAEVLRATYLLPAPPCAMPDRLTLREREIVQLLAESRTSKEIAARLGVSVKTVDAHRANIMRKLNLHSIAALVRYAVRNGIVEG